MILEIAIRVGLSGWMGKRYIVSVIDIKTLDIYSDKLQRNKIPQLLPSEEKNFKTQ